MRSHFHVKGHPVHAMLVAYPIALYLSSLICDLLFLWKTDPFWFEMAYWVMLFGLVGNLAANLTGGVDFLALLKEEPSARKTALMHLSIGWLLVVLYGLSLYLRNWGMTPATDFTPAFVLNLAGAGCVGLQGWYGGELVYRYRIGVGQ